MENKVIRYETQIQIVPSSMKQLNKQFALVDILLCYHGRNRNMTAMTKEVIETALPSLYGIPIVGEYIYLDDGSQDFGSHGGKIIISDKGIKFEDTTKPYGFITKEAVDNAKWVTITEKNGIQQHEYLELKNCIVWEKRYEEVSALLDKNYGQSMEIEINATDGYDSDGYLNIKEMTFSAACILGSNPDGTDVIPCFESACIGRHYELDSFKKEFALMLDEYKKFNESYGASTTTTVHNNIVNNNPQMKGDHKMDFAKITEVLSTETYKNSENKDICKYHLLNVTDTKVFALDMEESFKPCSFSYTVAKDKESNNEFVVIDFDSKIEMSLSATDKIEDENFKEFSIQETIAESIAKFSKENEAKNDTKIKQVTDEISEKFQKEYDELKESYDTLMQSHTILSSKVESYEKLENEARIQKHKEDIDSLVDSYSAKLEKCSAYLIYKANMNKNYSKTREEVEQDLILMAGKYLTRGETIKKKNFTYSPTESGAGTSRVSSSLQNRYGHLLDKYIS